MSRAMAMKCSFFATLMTRRNTEDGKVDITKIPTDGIWYGVEFPTLQLENNPGGKVDHVSISALTSYPDSGSGHETNYSHT